jgi:hypothetical protein
MSMLHTYWHRISNISMFEGRRQRGWTRRTFQTTYRFSWVCHKSPLRRSCLRSQTIGPEKASWTESTVQASGKQTQTIKYYKSFVYHYLHLSIDNALGSHSSSQNHGGSRSTWVAATFCDGSVSNKSKLFGAEPPLVIHWQLDLGLPLLTL